MARYVQYAYANSADGKTDFTTVANEGHEFIGFTESDNEEQSTNPDDYEWASLRKVFVEKQIEPAEVTYSWPIEIDELPAALTRIPEEKLSSREISDAIYEARKVFGHIASNHTWRHHSGTIYKVTGFGVSARDGQIEVTYRPFREGPLKEMNTDFHLPIRDWFMQIAFDVLDNDHPNAVDDKGTVHTMVHRFVPVFEVPRFETMRQIEATRD